MSGLVQKRDWWWVVVVYVTVEATGAGVDDS